MKKRTAKRLLLIPAVIVAGILIMVVLITGNKPPTPMDTTPLGILVDVFPAERTDRDVMITGYGTINALDEVALIPQVSGKVVWVHPDFLAGGSFNSGDALVRIEQADYELGVQQAEAMVAQAIYQLDVTKANAEIALTEWKLVRGSTASNEKPSPLVLNEPQMRQAEANLKSAQAALAKAELNLARTVITAPFNCKVKNENVALGQLIGPQGPIGTVYSTDIAEITVPLKPSEIPFIQIPGAQVDIVLENENGQFVYQGIVHRQVGVIGQQGRMAEVVVRMENPFAGGASALSLGSFVETRIHGIVAEDIIPVPRAAIHAGDQVWIANGDNTLSIQDVTIYFKTSEEVYVNEGVEEGELIVMTPINGAANGMKLRPQTVEANQ